MAVILRQRRDIAANWTANNPVIPDGQLCFDETNNVFKIGNGTDNYLDLPITASGPANLSNTPTTNQVTIESSTGDNTILAEASATIAGLMTTTHHDKLDGINAGADVTSSNETSHADVVIDGDFTSNGVMNRTGAGAYSILALDTDIQAYDVDTVKYDVAGNFTSNQGITFVTSEDNSIAFNSGNNLSFTATAANITVTNQTAGKSGTLVIASADNITGWGTEFDWGYQGVPTDLTGIEIFGYCISGASGVDSIKIGRV